MHVGEPDIALSRRGEARARLDRYFAHRVDEEPSLLTWI